MDSFLAIVKEKEAQRIIKYPLSLFSYPLSPRKISIVSLIGENSSHRLPLFAQPIRAVLALLYTAAACPLLGHEEYHGKLWRNQSAG